MTDLSAFGALFSAGDPLIYRQFGEVMTYAPPGGGSVEGVQVILEAEVSAGGYDTGIPGTGRITAPRHIGKVLLADEKLAEAGVSPVRGGIFTRPNGQRFTVDAAPVSENGEWMIDLVELKG